MTGNKRYFKKEYDEEYYIFDSETISESKVDKEIEYDYAVCADALTGDEVVNKLNEQEEQITALKSNTMNTNMANARLKEQIKAISKELDYIQNSITDKIKNQKTKIGEKALKEVIEDYNEWLLGHKEIVK